ncbi:MAG: aspartyl protease family protein [Fibromonadales bacterium]|nr:aspartyl protease family protein [Fibromonadales bacterium]
MINNAITYRFNGAARKIITPIGVSMPNGNPLEIVAVWDTGATSSVITVDVARRLNLCPEGTTVVNGVTGSQSVDTYLVTFTLPNGFSKDIFVVSCSEAIGCDVLVGMDIISIVDLAITSGSHGTTFSFKTPHGNEIDFSVV